MDEFQRNLIKRRRMCRFVDTLLRGARHSMWFVSADRLVMHCAGVAWVNVAITVVISITLMGSPANVSAADETRPETNSTGLEQSINEALEKELNSELKQELKKIYQTSQELRQLHEAEKAGLSTVMKTISPTGGRFELLPDGVVRIIPNDDTIVKQLLEKQQELSGDEAVHEEQKEVASEPGSSPADESVAAAEDKDISRSESKSKQSIDAKTLEIIQRLQKAEQQGLSNMLRKLAAEGGSFEIREDGGIRIIPSDTETSSKLLETVRKADEVVKEQQLSQPLAEITDSEKLVSAPVKSWKEARQRAIKWLESSGKENLKIGKIRLIKWVYVVSIVTRKGRMDTQLIIHSPSGQLFVANQMEMVTNP